MPSSITAKSPWQTMARIMVSLYVLLRPVNLELALLFLLLNAISVAIQVASYCPLIFTLLSGGAADFTQAFSAEQIDGLQLIYLNL